jgi:hypothetical protein
MATLFSKSVSTTPVDARLDRGSFIPTNIMRTGLLSTNTSAYTCFTKQRFSANLQAFLINYIVTVSAYQAIYK